jgi:hypothetical protein
VEQTMIDPCERLKNFGPVHSRLDYRLFEYGPVLVLGQFNAAGLAVILWALYNGFSPNPQLVTWAVASPVYVGVLLTLFIESLAIRNFLKKIPDTFRQLWEGGVFEKSASDAQVAEKFVASLDDFEHKLNSRQRLWLGLPFAVLGLFFLCITGHLPHVLRVWFNGSDLTTKLVTTVVNTVSLFVPAVGVGYAIGIGSWKSIVTGLYVRRFSRTFDLVIHPSHPDKAGGLRPLGDLIFAMAAILIVASLALSGLTVYAGYIYTEIFARVFLGLVFALSLIAFFLPLISAHERMLAEKREIQTLLVKINRRIAELERSLQEDLCQMDHKERQEVFAEIDSLTELYKRTTRVPTWPFDRHIFLRFATPQVISLLSLVGLADPIVSAIRSLILVLTGNQP